MIADEPYMHRALQLAQFGAGQVSPNPMVGCVIVHNQKIIGEGYHQKHGEPHAEVLAVRSVKDKSLLSESTVYVTLEPCSHQGKTPPCADLLVKHQVKKVVVCNFDPNPQVSGKGIKKLKNAGIDVELGVLMDEGRQLNKRFFTFHEKKRPYVILKWAQTQDGFVARKNFDSKWISNPYSRMLVHKWRAWEDAILVGTNTAKHDNPSLTVRDWVGTNPHRVVLDRNLELDESLKIFDEQVDTLILTEKKDSIQNVINVENLSPETILSELHSRTILSVFVEGGSKVLNSFIQSNLWDEARVFVSEASFGTGINAPLLEKEADSIEDVEGDKLKVFYNG